MWHCTVSMTGKVEEGQEWLLFGSWRWKFGGTKDHGAIIKINMVRFSHENSGGSTLVRSSARLCSSEKTPYRKACRKIS